MSYKFYEPEVGDKVRFVSFEEIQHVPGIGLSYRSESDFKHHFIPLRGKVFTVVQIGIKERGEGYSGREYYLIELIHNGSGFGFRTSDLFVKIA